MKTVHPVLAFSIARLKEFVRRPEAMFWVYFFPVLMAIVLGVAFRNQPREAIPVNVVEGPQAQQLMQRLEKLDDIEPELTSLESARLRLRTGKILLAVTPGESGNDLTYEFDPQRPGSIEARESVDARLQEALGREDVFASSDVHFSQPGGRYIDFLIPGLLAMGLMGGGLWGVGFGIVDMRIRKLLKRFMATPMKRTHFLLSMLLSRLVFMIPQIVILLVFAYLCFGVRVYGSWPALAIVILFGAFEFAAIGLLVGSRARTAETASGLMNLVMLPMWTLSGIFFSYERFPEIVHPIIRLLPLTPVIDALRAIMSDGKTLVDVLPEIGVIAVWCVVPFFLALAIFRWND
ncbi:ABC transporter permease [Mariniblastus fucicola]|uniref:ABC-2 family transporter protein n=1 Tax=Mariniblastus fucicola TaxID=980251 RepID=A0A5B9PHD7_9BACT|nr:ABC transporter permease [Mariniblastus fucicola]QEG24700.1 ABC-2 family transporter protein [Mariniblastus fucicola]